MGKRIESQLKQKGFVVESTGGNCNALVYRGKNKVVAVTDDCHARITAKGLRSGTVMLGIYSARAWNRGEEPLNYFTPKTYEGLLYLVRNLVKSY